MAQSEFEVEPGSNQGAEAVLFFVYAPAVAALNDLEASPKTVEDALAIWWTSLHESRQRMVSGLVDASELRSRGVKLFWSRHARALREHAAPLLLPPIMFDRQWKDRVVTIGREMTSDSTLSSV